MQQLEVVTNTKFGIPMKERVWDAVSTQRLLNLKETLILAISDQILGSFNEKEAAEILEEHKKTGSIKNIRYSAQIQTAYVLYYSSVIDEVVTKANSMADGLVPDLVAALKQEGIELPLAKK
jgi:hypothetical protein